MPLLLGLIGLFSGCGEGLKPFTVVDRLRIAAVATEPVAYQPGGTLSVRLLTLREADDTSPLSVLISGCVLAGPVQSCGPGSAPLQPTLPAPAVEPERFNDQPTGARVDVWNFQMPAQPIGPALIDAIIVNCDVGENPDADVIASSLATVLAEGEVKAPSGWDCAEDTLRMSRQVWIARHRVSPADPTAEAIVNVVPSPPVLSRMEDQTELDPGLIRTELQASTEGIVAADEPRWFWFSSSPNGVVMRVSADDGGKTKALVLDERDRVFSYWAIVRDSKGRVGWSAFHLPPDADIP